MDAETRQRFAQLESRVAQLNVLMNNTLSRNTFGSFEAEMRAEITRLQDQISALTERIEALERGE